MWMLLHGVVPGISEKKGRITFLACCNKHFNKRMPLMFIDTAIALCHIWVTQAWCLYLPTTSIQKSRVIEERYFALFSFLDAYIERTFGRKSLLLVDIVRLMANNKNFRLSKMCALYFYYQIRRENCSLWMPEPPSWFK